MRERENRSYVTNGFYEILNFLILNFLLEQGGVSPQLACRYGNFMA